MGIRIQEAQKHVNPVDPDSAPQHCLQVGAGGLLRPTQHLLRLRPRPHRCQPAPAVVPGTSYSEKLKVVDKDYSGEI